MSRPPIAFLGLGIMGRSMALNLYRAGFPLSVYNRNPERAADFATQAESEQSSGLTFRLADSPAGAAQSAEVILLCVSNAAAVKELLFSENGVVSSASKGALVVDFSTIAPKDAREIAARLDAEGLSFLDSPVSGGDIGAQKGTLTIMVGGKPADFERANEIFSIVGKKAELTGAVGCGQLTKCVNQLVVAISVAAMTEGLYFAKKVGLDLAKTVEIVGSGAGGSWSMDNYAPRVLKGEYGPGFYARDMLKDLRFVKEEAAALGLKLPTARLVTELYQEMCDGPGSEMGNHALITLYE